MKVLVVNSGSSSVKYQVIDTVARAPLVAGLVDRIGAGGAVLTQQRRDDGARIRSTAPLLDHRDAIEAILDLIADPERGAVESLDEIGAVGHRVVHGGEAFTESARIDPQVLDRIRELIALAPLHNPHNLAGIGAALARLPDVPHVAVFDTAFHTSMPPRAFHYALPYVLYERHRIRRYGFHGTSHQHVASRLADLLGRPLEELRLISIHLGNGASACAVAKGRSIDTSMGFTPLDGLVMGTRSGDLDAAAVLHVMGREEIGIADATALLNKHSGLQGLSGISSDMRDLLEEEAEGSKRAALALDVYTYRVRKYIGAYAAVLEGVDAVGFTGGIGQNAPGIRARCLEGLRFLGLEIDPEANERLTGGEEGFFHAGATAAAAIRTGEELVIALEAERLAAVDPSGSPG
ncbi:MAG: acetate kinase [Gemmatimonadetes bacterium]|nr:acetate kinase [Gemmatimonadota bacterium]